MLARAASAWPGPLRSSRYQNEGRELNRSARGKPAWRVILGSVAVSTVACAEPPSDPATVLYDDRVVLVEQTLAAPNDLWVTPEDLTRINGFEIKPQGVCLDELCIPLRQDEDSDLFVTRRGQAWFNMTQLAERLDQAFVVDQEHRVWSFGELPVKRTAFLESAQAPDFTLQDRDGNDVRLSDFLGKKVLIVTWASW